MNNLIDHENSANGIAPIHEAQLLSYLRLYRGCTRGLLINFNVKRLTDGIAEGRYNFSLCELCELCGSFNCLIQFTIVVLS